MKGLASKVVKAVVEFFQRHVKRHFRPDPKISVISPVSWSRINGVISRERWYYERTVSLLFSIAIRNYRTQIVCHEELRRGSIECTFPGADRAYVEKNVIPWRPLLLGWSVVRSILRVWCEWYRWMDGFRLLYPSARGSGGPHYITPHCRRTLTHIRSYPLTDVTGWRYLRRPPDSRWRRAQNWARNRTTPNENDEPRSDRAPALASWRTNLEHRSSSSGTRPRPCHELPDPPTRLLHRGLYYGAFILSLFIHQISFFILFYCNL